MNWCLVSVMIGASLVPRISNAQTADSQAPATIAEPQYINVFEAVEPHGELTELEHQSATFKSHSKILPGYATIKMIAEFKPAHSPVRVSPNARFVVRGRAPIDPSSRFELRLLKVSKDHREIVLTTGHGSLVGGSSTTTLDMGGVPIRFEEYGLNSYQITPAQPLAPGEYAIGLKGFVTELYCFSVAQ